MDEQLEPSDQELIEDAIDPTPAAQKRLEGLAERIGLTFEEQRIFVLEFEAAIFEAQLSAVGAEFGFTPGQQAIFNAEFRRLRDDVSRRKKILALPSLKQRATDLDALRGPVEKIKKARAPFLDGPPCFLSSETHAWLLEVDAVAVELATLAKPSRYEILNRGHERPNGYREWLMPPSPWQRRARARRRGAGMISSAGSWPYWTKTAPQKIRTRASWAGRVAR
jgi:hypothetical protein